MNRLAVWLRGRPEAITAPLLFVLFVGGWELTLQVFSIPRYMVPSPSDIARAFWTGLDRGVYFKHLWVTLYESVMGFGLGSALGIALGTVIALSRVVEKTVYPYIVAFQTLPKVAVAPLFIVWFGFGLTSKVVITAMVSFFPLLVNVIAGLKHVDEERLNLFRAMCASRWTTFRMLRWPNALPFIFAGLNTAIVLSVIGAIVGEFVGSKSGLGYLILQLNYAMDLAGVFAVLILLSIMGVALHLFLGWLHKRVVYWADVERNIGI